MFWRLVMEEKITYTEALKMHDEELEEANFALDHYINMIKKSSKKGGK